MQPHFSKAERGSDSLRGAMEGTGGATHAAAVLRLPRPGCGVRSLFSRGEKSWSERSAWEQDASPLSTRFPELLPLSEETEGDGSSSSLRFLFFSVPLPGDKKERMSCCLSFSN